MEFDRTGFILYTLNYKACVHFYQHILELKIMFTTDELTCFKFVSSYLMVELDDNFSATAVEAERTKTCMRMNVKNVKEMADKLTSKNIKVNYQEFSWGIVAKFLDPDGNLCAYKDSTTFENQIQ